MKKITDLSPRGKRVFVRCDFNVPLKDGRVRDNTRITASLPTILYLLEQNAAIVLASHLGRPKGKVVPEMSLAPVAEELKKLLPGRTVRFVSDCVGDGVKKSAAELKQGEILLLENLRFHPEEEKNDEKFARELASLAELFVQDAFGTVHRAHASTAGITRFLPSAAGLLVAKEVEMLSKILEKPERPFLAILGGAKVSSKIGVLENLITKVDILLIGGGMAYTFLKTLKKETGNSLLETELLKKAGEILKKAGNLKKKVLLPVDHVITESLEKPEAARTTADQNIPQGWMGVDIGEKTAALFRTEILKAKTIFWNGPLGVFETEPFSRGTRETARAIAEATSKGAISVIGGGDSIAAVNKEKAGDKITHLSTGGGASLEFMEGIELPGIEALQ